MREGMVIGAVAASKPRTVVVAAPVAYGAPVVYPSAAPTEIYVETPGAVYPPGAQAYPAQGYPAQGYPPATIASYPPAGVQAGVYVDPNVRTVGPHLAPGPVAVGAAVAAVAFEERRHFIIINEATCTILGVEKSCLKPGTFLVLDKRGPDRSFHQIWYFDREGCLRSKLTDFAPNGKKVDERVHMTPYIGDVRQQWVVEGNRIVNRLARRECLGLRKHLRLKDDADVIVSAYEGKPWQHWRLEPIII